MRNFDGLNMYRVFIRPLGNNDNALLPRGKSADSLYGLLYILQMLRRVKVLDLLRFAILMSFADLPIQEFALVYLEKIMFFSGRK